MTPVKVGFLGQWPTYRFAAVAAVFILSLCAFASGVQTTGVDDLQGSSILAWIYYSAGLFVFGGLDLGVPEGGPAIGRGALWIAFFLAPAITTTAIVEAALRLMRRNRLDRRKLKAHAVVVGAGRLGISYCQSIHRVEPGKSLLLVDLQGSVLSAEEANLLENAQRLRTALDRPEAFELLCLPEADQVIVLGDDDLLNLEIAWEVKQRAPELPVAVHVTDLTLLRPVSRLIRDAKAGGAEMAGLPLLFNTHRIAALHLYEHFLQPHFEQTGYRDVVVLGGFGHFPQTILELLRVTARDELEYIVIVDVEASKNVRRFGADVALDAVDFSAVDGDLEDPGTWARVDKVLEPHEAIPVYLLAAENEVLNFRSAMMLRRRLPDARIFARCFRRSAFAQSLARENDFELLAFEDVFQQALHDHYQTLASV